MGGKERWRDKKADTECTHKLSESGLCGLLCPDRKQASKGKRYGNEHSRQKERVSKEQDQRIHHEGNVRNGWGWRGKGGRKEGEEALVCSR